MARAASVVLAVLIVALAGCGGSSNSASTSTPTSTSATSAAATAGGGHRLQVAADPRGALRFTTSSLTATAGKVSVDFTNSSAIAHNLTIQRGTSGPRLGATPTFTGGSKVLELDLRPGRYTFYCSVPGHRQSGMQGTLVGK